MLNAKIVNSVGSPPRIVQGRTIVICDEFDNPLVVVAEIADKTAMITTIKDADFDRVLSSLGLNRTVVCSEIELPGPPANARLLTGPLARR